MGQINFLHGVMGVANAQRVLNYIRIFTEFITQPEYKNLVPMFGIMNEPVTGIIGKDQMTSLSVLSSAVAYRSLMVCLSSVILKLTTSSERSQDMEKETDLIFLFTTASQESAPGLDSCLAPIESFWTLIPISLSVAPMKSRSRLEQLTDYLEECGLHELALHGVAA
jgi:hypothetical protein